MIQLFSEWIHTKQWTGTQLNVTILDSALDALSEGCVQYQPQCDSLNKSQKTLWIMSSDYIEELIRQGGNTSIEFKQGDVRTENLAKELIAFSNSSGGVVLLGIEDNGEVQGLENQRSYEEWLAT